MHIHLKLCGWISLSYRINIYDLFICATEGPAGSQTHCYAPSPSSCSPGKFKTLIARQIYRNRVNGKKGTSLLVVQVVQL
jgi:hypothetical protein